MINKVNAVEFYRLMTCLINAPHICSDYPALLITAQHFCNDMEQAVNMAARAIALTNLLAAHHSKIINVQRFHGALITDLYVAASCAQLFENPHEFYFSADDFGAAMMRIVNSRKESQA